MNPFFGGHTKKGSLWEKICWQKSHKTFRASLGSSGKNPSHAQKFGCSFTYVQGLVKNMFAGGAKSGKIVFSPLETKKTTFSAKHLMGKYQFSKSWGPCPPLRHPYP